MRLGSTLSPLTRKRMSNKARLRRRIWTPVRLPLVLHCSPCPPPPANACPTRPDSASGRGLLYAFLSSLYCIVRPVPRHLQTHVEQSMTPQVNADAGTPCSPCTALFTLSPATRKRMSNKARLRKRTGMPVRVPLPPVLQCALSLVPRKRMAEKARLRKRTWTLVRPPFLLALHCSLFAPSPATRKLMANKARLCKWTRTPVRLPFLLALHCSLCTLSPATRKLMANKAGLRKWTWTLVCVPCLLALHCSLFYRVPRRPQAHGSHPQAHGSVHGSESGRGRRALSGLRRGWEGQEQRERLSAALRGRPKTLLHRENIAATQRRRHAAARVLRNVEEVQLAAFAQAAGAPPLRDFERLDSGFFNQFAISYYSPTLVRLS
jgi:hypothetical protein